MFFTFTVEIISLHRCKIWTTVANFLCRAFAPVNSAYASDVYMHRHNAQASSCGYLVIYYLKMIWWWNTQVEICPGKLFLGMVHDSVGKVRILVQARRSFRGFVLSFSASYLYVLQRMKYLIFKFKCSTINFKFLNSEF